MSWAPDWRGETVAIIASGPSAKDVDLDLLAGCKVLAINNSWQLWPTADVLYACDPQWWRHNRGLPQFTGLKITSSHAAARRYGLHAVTIRDRHEILAGPAGTIGSGRNGGFQAINLAVQFGPPRKIILIGYDMRVDLGVHWHGKHPTGLNNPDEAKVARWAALIDAVAPAIAEAGIEVFNISPLSRLTAWPKTTLEEALAA